MNAKTTIANQWFRFWVYWVIAFGVVLAWVIITWIFNVLFPVIGTSVLHIAILYVQSIIAWIFISFFPVFNHSVFHVASSIVSILVNFNPINVIFPRSFFFFFDC